MGLQEQLATALQNAHAAGDTQAAQQLAQALKQSMAQPQAAQQQSISAPPMPYSKEPPKQTDSALGYSVDQAQRLAGKGVEAFGDLIGSDTVKQYGTGVVADQDKDIEEGGYKSSYDGSLRETYEKGGFSEAVGWIAEGLAENAASGGVAIAGGGLATLTAPFSLGASAVIGGATLATSTAMATGESAFEQEEKTGDYDSKLAAGTGVIVGILDRFGASKVIPKPDLAKLSGQELVEKLIKAGKPNAAQAIGKRILKSTVSEGATETAQEAVIAGSAAVRGGEYTQDELIDRGLESFVLGGAMGGSTTTTLEAAKATGRGIQNVTGTAPEVVTPEVQAARSDFANRLQNIAVQNGMNLNNVGKMGSKGAVDAVDVAHKDIVKDITLAVSSINKDATFSLNEKTTDSAELAAKKANARNAISAAKNKVKGIVSTQDISALEELVGGTLEGQQLLNAIRESNELTALHKSGYVGGVSQYTDLLAPMGGGAGYDRSAINAERLLRPLLTGGAAAQTGGVSLVGQTAGFVAGRAIDAVTGRRSRVARYIKKNTGQGQGTTSTISTRSRAIDAYRRKEEERRQKKLADLARRKQAADERARKKAQEEADRKQERETNIQMYKDGTRQTVGYNPNSPQQTLLDGTGMDLKNIEIALLEIIATGHPRYAVMARTAMKSLREGGRIGPQGSNMLSNLIKVVNARVDTGSSKAVMVRPRDTGAINRHTGNEAIQRGIEANKAAAQALIDAVDADQSLDPVTKGIIKRKLTIFRDDDLGIDPLGRANQELQDALTKIQANNGNTDAANNYLGQYIQRIQTQQDARKRAEQPQPPQPQPQPPQPQPEPPQPQPEPPIPAPPPLPPYPEPKKPTDPIGTDLTPDTIPQKTKAAVKKSLTGQVEAAARDPRNIDHWAGASIPSGEVKLGTAFTPEGMSLILALQKEIAEIANRFDLPQIQGIGTIRQTSNAIAKMGGGIMYFNPKYFNAWAINKTPIGGSTVTYDPNVTFNDRPHNTFRYYDTGLDRARNTVYHEMGHHIHQMLFPAKPLSDSTGPWVRNSGVERWLMNNEKDFLGNSNKDALPSRYARTTRFEWFAENFAEYFMGHKERVDPMAIKLIDSILNGEFENA